jgi:predicted  nucleic acid-binding Zn-ribbon protein
MEGHDLSIAVQIALWFLGALQAISIAAFTFLFGRIRDAERKAEAGDVAVINSLQKSLSQFETSIREQRDRLNEAREAMLTKDVWREDLREIFRKMDMNAASATESRNQVMERMSSMQVAAAKVESQADAVSVQLGNFVEAQAELTTSVVELRSELKRHYPIVPLMPIPPGMGNG